MPCHTIRRTPVTFEKVAYRPGHLDLLVAAVHEMGYQVACTGNILKICPKGRSATTENTIAYGGGVFQIPSTLKDRFTLDRVQEAYARQAVRLHARRNGWLLREINEREFIVARR